MLQQVLGGVTGRWGLVVVGGLVVVALGGSFFLNGQESKTPRE